MDRQAWIAVTLCVLGLIGWQAYMSKHYVPPPPRRVEAASPSPSPVDAAAPAASSSPAAVVEPVSVAAETAAATPTFAEKIETLRNADVELRLTNRGGGIKEAVLLKHTADTANPAPVLLNSGRATPIGAILDKPTSTALAEYSMAKQPDGAVQLDRVSPEHIAMRQRFSLSAPPNEKDNFVAEMQVEFRNEGDKPYANPGYFVALGSAAPIHDRDMPTYTRLTWCIEGKAKGQDVSWFAEQNSFFGLQKRPAQDVFAEHITGAEWAGVANQFFTTLLTPLTAKATEISGRRFVARKTETQTFYGIEGSMGLPGFNLAPGQTSTAKFQIYAGPKLYGRLAKLEHDEAEIMNFGIFKLVSQALLNLMNLIHRYVGNYAVAILILTAIIKGILWPLQNKANKSMRHMSALSPKMTALKEKYKDDPTRMNQEVMKLYKEHGVNPVGGCLPMMIQIPIFFGLLSMLGQAVELRNAHFLWVRDLSQPDTVAHIPGLGYPINILPLLMGLSNVWLMRMTPKTGDSTQQRVMMFMPLIFLFFCYNFAAALALYYTTQNLFTILQLWHNQRQPVPVLASATAPAKRAKKARP